MTQGGTIPSLLSRQEAANRLGVGERTLREHIKAGRLRFIAVGTAASDQGR